MTLPTCRLPVGRWRSISTILRALWVLGIGTAASGPLQGGTRYWSANGTTSGGDGVWNTSTVNRWATTAGGPWTLAWNNSNKDVAENSSATANITLGAHITLGGFTQKAGGASTANSIEEGSGRYTLTLGASGANTFLAAANTTTGRSLIVNASILGGSGNHLVLAGPASSGIGTITLGRANSFSGTTTFSAGVTGGARVVLGHPLALQNSTVTLSPQANVVFDGNVSSRAFTFGGLASAGAGGGASLALRNSTGAGIALTVGGNHADTAYRGVLGGAGSLIKAGTGTLVLAGANAFTGPTTVTGGTLQVDGSSVSPTTVQSGAILAGNGVVDAAVTIAAGGSIRAARAEGAGESLTVSSLTFNGSGTVDVGELSGLTGNPAITVTRALGIAGGAGAVTINLPPSIGYTGTFHLIRFGSGPVDARNFTLGTLPVLAWNQKGALHMQGNDLIYVITAVGDTSPPVLTATSPGNDAVATPGTEFVATFHETISPGIGLIELRRNSDGGLVESFETGKSPRLAFQAGRLTIRPSLPLPGGSQYHILIPTGAVKDPSGNTFGGITGNTGWRFTVAAPAAPYTDTGSPVNPPWSQILPTLNVGSADPGPVHGSAINVNHAAVEVGLYGNRPILVPSQRIHVACHTSTANFANFTRWFQTDGNTHVLRVFVDDENTATAREGTSSHTEAFMGGGWNHDEGRTHEWTGRYTIARIEQGYCAFQLKNSDNDWAFQLAVGSGGSLTVNNRNSADVVVVDAEGAPLDFRGRGFDVRVLDDGLNYKVWIDGILRSSGSYSRPTGTSTFRWGMYFGADNLNPPADQNVLLVSGAQIKSWPGKLTTTPAPVIKANNTTNLENGASWVGGIAPGLHHQALWSNTVTAANSATVATAQQWSGLAITNPGGTVTIQGGGLLGLDRSGLDLSAATRDLVVNCPVQLTASNPWTVAAGRAAAFHGAVGGHHGLTVAGSGTVRLEGANTYLGGTVLSGGTVVANGTSALGAGVLVLAGGNLSTSAGCTLANEVVLERDADLHTEASQTLWLKGSVAGDGRLTKNGAGTLLLSGTNPFTGATLVKEGTLLVGSASALLRTRDITLAGTSMVQPVPDGVVIQSPVTLMDEATTATVGAPASRPGSGVVSTLTLRGAIGGAGNVVFSSNIAQNALSTVFLAAQSTYAGGTLLDTTAPKDGITIGENQIIVRLGTHDALPPTTVLTIDGGNGSGTGRFAEMNLNGFNQQLAGLNNPVRAGARAALRRQRVVNSNVSPYAMLTIRNPGDHTFSGSLGTDTANGSVSAAAMPGSTHGNHFGLTKSGKGTLVLSGTNTYAGETVIQEGVLSLGSANPSNDASIMRIAESGATLHLGFVGTDSVDQLFIGTTRRPAGVYGAPGSPAPVTGIPQISGTGTITVASSPISGFDAWRAIHAPSGTASGDHDGDGVPNAIEYVVGGTASTRDRALLPTVSDTAGAIVFSFIRDQTSIDGRTSMVIESGNDLANWPVAHPVPDDAVSNPAGLTVRKNVPGAGKDTITLVLPRSQPTGYLRLKVIP